MFCAAGRLGLVACLTLAVGCAAVIPKGSSPLAKPCMSPDSVVLEIFFVRFPFDDPQINGDVWREIDEQPFEAALRKQLSESGFRIGLIKGELPSDLQKLIAGSTPVEPVEETKPAADETAAAATTAETPPAMVVKVEEESATRKRTLTVRAGHRSEILASGVYESLPLVERNALGELHGKPYPKGQGVLALKSFPQGDGRVRIELAPELQYGDQKLNYVADQGMLRMETGRTKRAFNDLALSATLAPGEMIVLGSLPQRRGSLGHYFFTEPVHGSLEQKLVIIRLAQTQYDDLFGPEMIVPAEE